MQTYAGRSIVSIAAALCSCVCIVAVAAETAHADGRIRFKSGDVAAPFRGANRAAADAASLVAQSNASRHIVVVFDRPITRAERSTLADAGMTLQRYLGDNAYFASIESDRANAGAWASVAAMRTAMPIARDWKLHPSLARGDIQPWSIVAPGAKPRDPDLPAPQDDTQKQDPIVGAYVLFHSDVAADAIGAALVARHGGRTRSFLRSINGLVVELPYSQIASLAERDEVMYIEPPLPKFSGLNNSNRLITGAEVVQAPPYSLDGSGVTVLVYDAGTGLASHPDFGGRLTVRDASGLNDHSTHVAGTVGGDGTDSGGLYRGMAPGVTIESYGFEQPGGLQDGFLYSDPGDLEDDYDEAINVFDADIANNSIGTNTAPNGFPCEWEGNYGVTGNLIDAIVRGSLGAPFRVVWANGNERQGTARCGATYHTTAPPACAKNHITVGALNSNDDSVTSFTSWGPTDDGRLKPDVSGPGCQSNDDFEVTSTSSSGGYVGKCGTSMASPTVCGLGALLLQDYRDQFPGEPDFRNSTLKVLLAHTAEDVEAVGPDYKTGYGSVRIEPAINLMRAGNFIEENADQGTVYSLIVVVGPSDSQFKATLAWDDVPGTPNVDPALVNDLDLQVFDPTGARRFPWTLDPANPANPAVQTAEDHLNNIEQVAVDNPQPGVWRIDVVGFNVPAGPQPFSLAASPTLVNCSDQGIVDLDRGKFACESEAQLQVVDCGLNTDDMLVETVTVQVASDSEPAGESVMLIESAAESAQFIGSIILSETDAPGVLQIANGDTVTATYIDADDGDGGVNVIVTDTALIDCDGPVISNIQALDVQPRSATIGFDTDEDAHGTVHYGLTCGSLNDSASGPLVSSHTISLSGVVDNTTYFYSVEAADEAGNLTTDDDGGACYSFATPEVPDFFTEQFAGNFDLDNKAILLEPAGGVDRYAACAFDIGMLPTDPAGGTTVTLTDDGSATVNLASGATVSLYDASYATVYINANGSVTFDATDGTYTETFPDHFANARVAALFDDLNPSTAGNVSWKQLSDRFVVTWQNVPEYDTTNSNTFQIELYFNGNIQIAWLGIDSTDCIAGLSEGLGVPADFLASDLSAAGGCGPRPPYASGASHVVGHAAETLITLSAGDDGLPDPPAALTYILTALPGQELRDAGNDQPVNAVPYALVAGGNQVIYAPTNGFFGADSFQFKANDAGTPPDGGDSNIATVQLQVEPLLSLPFTDDFNDPVPDPDRWALVRNVQIDGTGLAEPSPPNSLRLNGDPSADDAVHSQMIDLSGGGDVRLSYAWQRTGGGESPDAGDDLYVEFLDGSEQWQVINQHLGSGSDMTSFQQESLILPPAALHAGFRLRLRCTATAGLYDDWFVDDVRLVSADAPVAMDKQVHAPRFTSIDVTLEADDLNNDPLQYVVLSLPSAGQLIDPGTGAAITTTPYVLTGLGDAVRYMPAPFDYEGDTAFEFMATDALYQSEPAQVQVTVGGPDLAYSWNMDSDPGWAMEGSWAYGAPAGASGDPAAGYTGQNVCGYNLAGDYTNSMPRYALTTAAIDCSDLFNTKLRFRRWLGVESSSYDHAAVEASNDGAIWTVVWDHSGPSLDEQSWSLQTLDVSSVADGQPTLYIRWIMGTTDGSVVYHGWNIDDVEILGTNTTCSTPGDLDGDGDIDLVDMRIFTLCYGPDGALASGCPCANVATGDLDVDLNDWSMMELLNTGPQ